MVPVQLRAVAFASDDPSAAASFWAGVLDRPVVEDDSGLLVPGDTVQLGLRFVPSRCQRTEPDRMHLHLTSSSPEHQRSTVTTAVALGARHVVENALSVTGPVRETYLVGPRDTGEPTAWRTEIAWPVFGLSAPAAPVLET